MKKMKKQLIKNLKEYFQLPGKFSIALENLLGQSKRFFNSLNSNLSDFPNTVINNNWHLIVTNGTSFASTDSAINQQNQ
jgi:hypothetical protein